MAEGVQSYEELSANLQDYLQQQQQVRLHAALLLFSLPDDSSVHMTLASG